MRHKTMQISFYRNFAILIALVLMMALVQDSSSSEGSGCVMTRKELNPNVSLVMVYPKNQSAWGISPFFMSSSQNSRVRPERAIFDVNRIVLVRNGDEQHCKLDVQF